MGWLNPANARSAGYDPETRVLDFVQKYGQLGQIALEAWNAVDPLQCLYAPDEYLGYARRFVESAATGVPPSEWSKCPGLTEELVRRSFHPAQVCRNTSLGSSWVTAEDIRAIAQCITERAGQFGGIEQLLPKS